jgi:hypothetical protein
VHFLSTSLEKSQPGDFCVGEAIMKTLNWLLSLLVFCTLASWTAPAATLCVWQGSPSPASPYRDWASAAHTIQEAVDAANTDDTVLVTNGVYATGRRTVGTDLLANRVAVDKPVLLQSVNGPTQTVIQGYQVSGTTHGDGAIRCVYLADGAILSGFTLTNGATRSVDAAIREQCGGGLCCESFGMLATNCVLAGNSACYEGGGVSAGILKDCTLTGNSASTGGGASGTRLDHCTLVGNSANEGGGTYGATMLRCTLAGNSAAHGGAVSEGRLENCRLTGNTAYQGGGAAWSDLYNCTVTGNSSENGGGIYGGTLNNCTVAGNSAGQGGGACYATLNNCTLTGNAAGTGGGVSGGTFNNCIVFFNTATNGQNYSDADTLTTVLNYCCTTPLPTTGVGNITNEPAFVNLADGDFHLRYGSPCIDAGTDLGTIITNDFDGHPRPLDGSGDGIAAVDLGAYEFVPPACYVWQNSPSPSHPFNTWATAAHTLQEAVDAADAGDTVLVTNGIYSTGGKATYGLMTNRMAIDKPLTVLSANGPAGTIILGAEAPGGGNGERAIRCAYVGGDATLSGFTLTNGHTLADGDWDSARSGGGVFCEVSGVVTNCVIRGNAASAFGGGAFYGTLRNCALTDNSAWQGGGAADGTLHGCTLRGNSATNGGGACESTLGNCTLTGNSASALGGGAYGCTLNNCIVYFNTASASLPNCDWLRPPNYCCTLPLPTNGFGNITNPPLFVDLAGGNLRLQANSPCINSGNNVCATTASDQDGNPRIVSGTVDLGAYEYQGAGSTISYAWLQQYGLPTDGTMDLTDNDGDSLDNRREWQTDTNPHDVASVLRLSIPSSRPPVAVTFLSSAARLYTLQCCANLTPSSGWAPVPGQTDVPGTGEVLTLTDTNPPAPAFYRVSVRFP